MLLLNELSPSGMGLRGCNVVGPIRQAALAVGVEKKRECALAYTSERLCMDWQFDESTGGNSLDIMHRGEGKFGTC